MSNRWYRTVYTGYGRIKQKIFLQILQQCQEYISAVMNYKGYGDPLKQFNFLKSANDLELPLDMSKICHYNNYFQVRTALQEMSRDPIDIYFDPTFKKKEYVTAPLLNCMEPFEKGKIVRLRIKKSIVELLLHVDRKKEKDPKTKEEIWVPKQYCEFDRDTLKHTSTKYMWPLYTMICSWASKGGFTMDVAELRTLLQVEEKYKGFDNLNRFVLQHVEKELQIFGLYNFSFLPIKKGRDIVAVQFKVFKSKNEINTTHAWMKFQKALNEDLPYFARLTYEQREWFNYLLTSKYSIDEATNKLHHVHKALIKRREGGQKTYSIFDYTIKAFQNDFPPPG